MERLVASGSLVVPTVLVVVASVLGLLAVRSCFGRVVMWFFVGASITALVLVVGTVLHQSTW